MQNVTTFLFVVQVFPRGDFSSRTGCPAYSPTFHPFCPVSPNPSLLGTNCAKAMECWGLGHADLICSSLSGARTKIRRAGEAENPAMFFCARSGVSFSGSRGIRVVDNNVFLRALGNGNVFLRPLVRWNGGCWTNFLLILSQNPVPTPPYCMTCFVFSERALGI